MGSSESQKRLDDILGALSPIGRVDNEDHPMTRSPDDPMKVLIATPHRLDLWIAPQWFSERLTRDFPQLKIVRIDNFENFENDISDAEIAFTFALRPEHLQPASKIHCIHSPSPACHRFLFP